MLALHVAIVGGRGGIRQIFFNGLDGEAGACGKLVVFQRAEKCGFRQRKYASVEVLDGGGL